MLIFITWNILISKRLGKGYVCYVSYVADNLFRTVEGAVVQYESSGKFE